MFNINPKYVKIEYVIVPLTQGKVALVDPVDADLACLKWYAAPSTDRYYASKQYAGSDGKRRAKMMHRIILERILERPLIKGEIAEHKNNNPLDNRRENLRLATHAENMRNAKKPKNNTSGYKGVRWNNNSRKWHVRINLNGKEIHLGYFDNLDDAVRVRREATIKYHGEFGRLE